MKFIINSAVLLKELQRLSGVLSTNNTLPILDNFLFEIANNKINIIASDLENTMICSIDTEEKEEGRIAIPARLLLDTLKTFSSQPLTFLIDEKTYAVEINSDSGKYKLSGQNPEEFPKVPELGESFNISINGSILMNAINKTVFACGNDELRPVMSGILCEISDNNLTFVATDAHKLVKYTCNSISVEKPASFILPKKPMNLLKNNLTEETDINVNYNETNVVFSYENISIICRLIDGKYPNYEAVIPKENPNKLIIETELLLSRIKRVSLYANKTTHQIRLKIAGSELQINSEDLDFANEADERLTCEYKGEDMEIGFNSKFIIEMLSNIGSKQVSLEMSSPNRAGILLPLDGQEENEGILMLVMPVMLNS